MLEHISEFAKEHLYLSMAMTFFVGIIGDYIYARYMLAVADRKPIAAANWSFLFTVLAIFLTLSIVEKSIPHIVSYLIGGYAGTYFATKNASVKELKFD